MSDWKEKESQRAKELAEQVAKFVNSMSNDHSIKEFCKAMGRDHRTLQQSFSKLCYEWIRFQSEQYEAEDFDGRNEYACKVAHKIMNHDELKYETQMPLI